VLRQRHSPQVVTGRRVSTECVWEQRHSFRVTDWVGGVALLSMCGEQRGTVLRVSIWK
jgi:hypothetical protein